MKDSTSNAGDAGSIPGLERSPGEGNATYSSILAWEVPPIEEPGGILHGVSAVGHDLETKPPPQVSNRCAVTT